MTNRAESDRVSATDRLLRVAGRLVLTLLLLTPTSMTLAQGRPAEAQEAAQETLPDEYLVKAAFIYSFGRYVEWPPKTFSNESDPFVVGILGEDSFGGALDEIAKKKTIHGRRIVIERFASVADYKRPCQILFVSRSVSPEEQAAVIAKTKDSPVFLVGETPGFAEQGATANFTIEGDRIRFEINVTAVRRTQLRMDAKLLSLGLPVNVRS